MNFWDKDYCPICNFSLEKQEGMQYTCHYTCTANIDPMVGRVHYSKHIHNNTSQSEQIVVLYPYYIRSYPDVTNVYKYVGKGQRSNKVILEIPHLNIDWDDLEATKKKIELYILFS